MKAFLLNEVMGKRDYYLMVLQAPELSYRWQRSQKN
jgi:hypothetical protein